VRRGSAYREDGEWGRWREMEWRGEAGGGMAGFVSTESLVVR
jgi:hypothetical protein